MMKWPDFDTLLRNNGWRGIIVSSVWIIIFYIVVDWMPQIYTWMAVTFLSIHPIIDERRHMTIMYLADFMVIIMAIINLMYIIRLLRKRKSKKQQKDPLF